MRSREPLSERRRTSPKSSRSLLRTTPGRREAGRRSSATASHRYATTQPRLYFFFISVSRHVPFSTPRPCLPAMALPPRAHRPWPLLVSWTHEHAHTRDQLQPNGSRHHHTPDE